MTNIKNDLKHIINETMIPESNAFLEELNLSSDDTMTQTERKEAIRDMESFLVELQNIILAIDENKISDDEAQEVYQKIVTMLDEHAD